jgi:hypothetical protein
MQPFVGNVAALAVAVIFYLWRAHHQVYLQRQQMLRERVAYMLWIMADQMDADSHPVSAN